MHYRRSWDGTSGILPRMAARRFEKEVNSLQAEPNQREG